MLGGAHRHPQREPTRKPTGAIDLGEENLPFHDRPAEGMIVTTEQSWSAQGVTLGRLLHSLALAAGESTKVAVVDGQGTTRATGTEETTEADTLSSTTDQNRSISEVANAIAREEQHGDSTARGLWSGHGPVRPKGSVPSHDRDTRSRRCSASARVPSCPCSGRRVMGRGL
ncbi:hypothetical protein [Streptomyces clavuligerus]|uniref:Uncharacterized protein n=1 Tax=Streptomyces clavuligerus TaxID=1901 RepID=B5GS20_STRCL|nr:hypothetical protein [Streptomyces clavuligerus]EDY49116.1 hypothetical protein SSCG_02144 [Streptomyces clavuligerus]EFG03813.1 Hypothetical protein SCLAV_p0322 [Streptomyces clavuligerus]MBY6307662.1 hypothetical protein [Streptomyces clavuligerus]QCS09789.1 hypothetical protein CRV15_29695 [Streptomyces clavuligerus]QPJ98169.1 hypothetical protein GE265_34715 [Streptomyces clavuligerus]